ncbi:MAG: response regulator [Oligoflexales bacterium]|nr:response regulator [Oligoflexales bacterium]
MAFDKENINILVVDDDEDILEATKMVLADEYHFPNISLMDHAEKALEFLRKNPVDIIFSDIKMPDMDGIDFLKTIKKENLFYRVFVFITGQASTQSVIETVKLGVFDYIEKPFDDSFNECIQNICQFLSASDVQSKEFLDYDNINKAIYELGASLENLKGNLMLKTSSSILIRNSNYLQNVAQTLSAEAGELLSTALKIKLKLRSEPVKEIELAHGTLEKIRKCLTQT